MIYNSKVSLLFLFVMLCATGVCAQHYDNVWLFGYGSNPNNSIYGGTVLDFSNDSLDIFYQNREMNLDVTNASISNSEGELLFYTNGIYIANSLHEPMENGDGLNPGEVADDQQSSGYILDQGAIIIPKPGSDSLFYLFHARREYPGPQLGWHCSLFYYSLIDMSLNGGLGAVIEKNKVIVDDILTVGQITATKHSNGRDWWILFRKYESNQYYRILVSPHGIENLGIQEIGLPFSNGVGQAIFSPDGSKYIVHVTGITAEGNLINIYDFDRCTGLLSNPIQTTNNDSLIGSGGAAISPNSRYLYLSANHYIYQYDLHSNDILSTKDTVAEYDGFQIPITPTFGLSTRFFLMQLAPNGKIYISIPNGVNLLHVINNPNEEGEACNVLQHSVELPTYNAFSLPNFPNYKLGAEIGSLCDTITSIKNNPLNPKFNVKVFPNPTSDYINFQIESVLLDKADIGIYNLMGQKVFSHFIEKNENNFKIDLSDFPAGTYFYKLKNDKSLIYQDKFIIQR